jgi:hypothetical protein
MTTPIMLGSKSNVAMIIVLFMLEAERIPALRFAYRRTKPYRINAERLRSAGLRAHSLILDNLHNAAAEDAIKLWSRNFPHFRSDTRVNSTISRLCWSAA